MATLQGWHQCAGTCPLPSRCAGVPQQCSLCASRLIQAAVCRSICLSRTIAGGSIPRLLLLRTGRAGLSDYKFPAQTERGCGFGQAAAFRALCGAASVQCYAHRCSRCRKGAACKSGDSRSFEMGDRFQPTLALAYGHACWSTRAGGAGRAASVAAWMSGSWARGAACMYVREAGRSCSGWVSI